MAVSNRERVGQGLDLLTAGLQAFVERGLKQAHGDKIACISIGPAGENLVRGACVIQDRGRAFGRCGIGAVMGSKRLKAVVARGTMAVPMADKDTVDKLRTESIKAVQTPGPGGGPSFQENWHKYGTSGIVYGGQLKTSPSEIITGMIHGDGKRKTTLERARDAFAGEAAFLDFRLQRFICFS